MTTPGGVLAADVLDTAVVFRVPLRVPFRGVTDRIGVLLAGPAGFGEFAPFPEYPPVEAARWLDAALEAALLGWPAPVRDRVGVNAIVPALSAQAAGELAAAARVRGARTIKVKVAAGSLDADADRLAAVRESFGAGAIRVDANGGWNVEEAVAAIRRLDRVAGGLQYVEQPCANLEDLARVRAQVSVPVAADESIRRAADPVRAVEAGAADVLVLKSAPLGGVRSALRIIARTDVPVVVSSAMDTSVGLRAALALAAALPRLDYDCGLGTSALLADDLTAPSLLAAAGGISVPMGADGRVDASVPDPAAVARATARVSPAERREWLARLRAAWSAGSAERFGDLVADSRI
ncbi:MAG: o-succinylbenzoate synthase [Actinobacteria bacterium]|nr:o-succinylbenzoate synthase [Actinomycetota bacterium]